MSPRHDLRGIEYPLSGVETEHIYEISKRPNPVKLESESASTREDQQLWQDFPDSLGLNP